MNATSVNHTCVQIFKYVLGVAVTLIGQPMIGQTQLYNCLYSWEGVEYSI